MLDECKGESKPQPKLSEAGVKIVVPSLPAPSVAGTRRPWEIIAMKYCSASCLVIGFSHSIHWEDLSIPINIDLSYTLLHRCINNLL